MKRPYDQYALQITKMATKNVLLASNFINVEASTNIIQTSRNYIPNHPGNLSETDFGINLGINGFVRGRKVYSGNFLIKVTAEGFKRL